MKGRAAVLQAVFVFLPPCLRCFFLTVVIITINSCVKTTTTSCQTLNSSYRKIQVVLVFESNRLGGAYRNSLKYKLGVEVWGTPKLLSVHSPIKPDKLLYNYTKKKTFQLSISQKNKRLSVEKFTFSKFF